MIGVEVKNFAERLGRVGGAMLREKDLAQQRVDVGIARGLRKQLLANGAGRGQSTGVGQFACDFQGRDYCCRNRARRACDPDGSRNALRGRSWPRDCLAAGNRKEFAVTLAVPLALARR